MKPKLSLTIKRARTLFSAVTRKIMLRIDLVVGSILIWVIVSIALAIPYNSYTIHNAGQIVAFNLEVYKDLNPAVPLTEINWGPCDPGTTVSYTAYIKSIKGTPTVLTLTTDSWNPLNASDYLTLTWNYDNSTLKPNEIREVTFYLTIDPDISGIQHFSFNLVVAEAGIEGLWSAQRGRKVVFK